MIALSGCASYNPGNDASVMKSDAKDILKLSSAIDRDFSTDDLVFLNFYLENKSAEWARIKNVSVLAIENNLDAKIVIGQDLVFWAKAIEHKVAIDNQNRQAIMTSLALAGAGIAVEGASRNSSGSINTGVAMASGALTIEGTQSIFGTISDLERSKLVPEDHLFTPSAVPPHLVLKKWLLVQTKPKSPVHKIVVKVIFEDNTSTVFVVNV
jgi:hypothetical protein